jgi:PKD repeat protein
MKPFFLQSIIILLLYSNISFAQQFICAPTPNTSNIYPFEGSATTNLRQWIYYPSDFPGIVSGNITDIYFKANAAGTPSFTNLTIKIGFTALATFPNTNYITGLQTVYNAPYSAASIAGNYIKVTLQTPFAYNNTQNIVVEASQTGYAPGFGILQGTSGFTNRSIYGGSAATSGSIQARLGCIGFDLAPANPPDIGITALVSPSGTFCNNQQGVEVAVHNFGAGTASNFTINWSLNGIPQTAYNYTGTLQPNNGPGQYIDTVFLGTGTFNSGNNIVKAWTSITNDINKNNDTLLATIAPATFTLSSLQDTICLGTGTLLNITPVNYNVGILQWQQSTDGITFNNITNNPFFDYQTPALNNDMYYRVFINSGTTGCYSSIVKINVLDQPFIVDLGNDTAICSKVNITLDAGNIGAQYLWQDNSTNQTFLVNTPGTYYVKVTDPIGCSVTDTIHVAEENYPSGYFDMNNWGGYNNPTYTFVAHLQNAVSFFWDFGDGTPTSTSNPVNHTYMNIGSYTAKLHIFNECGTEKILSKSTDIKVGTNEIELDNYLEIFPNPTNNYVNIHTKDNLIMHEINIIDALGRTTIQEKLNSHHAKIDVRKLAAGVYSIIITTAKGTSVQKLSIQ